MHADNWANKAKQEGYRTRAVYKLEEILQKTKSLKKSQNVLDLGSAPGGWSHYIKKNHLIQRFMRLIYYIWKQLMEYFFFKIASKK
jgi:23S rRNA U2552 (ribose-2'-O)-methylase RlmE/FtsJ